jgi:hypothetical protein
MELDFGVAESDFSAAAGDGGDGGVPSARAEPIMRPVMAVVIMSFFNIFRSSFTVFRKQNPLARDNASASMVFRRNCDRDASSVITLAGTRQPSRIRKRHAVSTSAACEFHQRPRTFVNDSLSLNAVNPWMWFGSWNRGPFGA